MADKVDLEIAGVVENMSGFTTPAGERFPIFGEGGGQELADELDVPLLGKVPLTMPLREQADAGVAAGRRPTPTTRPRRRSARPRAGIIAMTPVELPVMQRRPRPRRPGAAGATAGRHRRCRWRSGEAVLGR